MSRYFIRFETITRNTDEITGNPCRHPGLEYPALIFRAATIVRIHLRKRKVLSRQRGLFVVFQSGSDQPSDWILNFSIFKLLKSEPYGVGVTVSVSAVGTSSTSSTSSTSRATSTANTGCTTSTTSSTSCARSGSQNAVGSSDCSTCTTISVYRWNEITCASVSSGAAKQIVSDLLMAVEISRCV